MNENVYFLNTRDVSNWFHWFHIHSSDIHVFHINHYLEKKYIMTTSKFFKSAENI